MNNIIVVIGRATSVAAFHNAVFSKDRLQSTLCHKIAVDGSWRNKHETQQIAMWILRESCGEIIFGPRWLVQFTHGDCILGS